MRRFVLITIALLVTTDLFSQVTMLTRRPTEVAAASFVPTDIAGCSIWMYAGQPEFDGYADGQAVALITNKGIRASFGLAVSTASKKPIYTNNAYNGKPAIMFDNTDDNLASSSVDYTTFVNTNSQHIFFVCNAIPGDGYIKLWAWAGSTACRTFFGFDADKLQFIHVAASTQGRLTAAAGGGTNCYNTLAVYEAVRRGAESAAIYTNGVAVATTTSVATNLVTGISEVCYIPGGYGTADRFDFAEMIIYSNSLADIDRASVSNYFKTKYGIP